ncbi:MAG TPA: hypothetical protein VEA78_00810 [Acidimicrobiales bacterium]|nr:hypothetical protein [Acidimicrobiales bacterium]
MLRTEHWDVVHGFGMEVEGWIVLATRRHVAVIADLTEAEAAELGTLVHRASVALRVVLGVEKTYVAQFAESPDHAHVHVHVIPRPEDPAFRGPSVFGLMNGTDVPEARMDEIALALRAALGDR